MRAFCRSAPAILALAVNWLLKAALQKGMSALPASQGVNYVFQRRVTRTLPIGDAGVRRKFLRAAAHFDAFREHGPRRAPETAVFYEFGAGWDLSVPLSYASLGVGRQILVDIRPNLRLELVNETIASLDRQRADLARETGCLLRELGRADLASAAELEERFGIVYLAPRDARRTGLANGCVDFVSSTNTLEHVPATDIGAILRECRRLLASAGVMSFRIDMQDHSSYADPRLSPYHFLRYSTRTWRAVSSPLNYQNRLRYPDYAELFREAGLEIVSEEVTRPTAGQLAALSGLELAPEFHRYAPEELAARALAVVVRPAPRPLPDGTEELEHVAGRGPARVGPRTGA
jgi:SAM-dependent methyltransferase